MRGEEEQAVRFSGQRSRLEGLHSNLAKLLELAGVLSLSEPEIRTSLALDAKWGVVKDWNEQSRYEKQGRKKAKAMLDAVDGPQGILECIKGYW